MDLDKIIVEGDEAESNAEWEAQAESYQREFDRDLHEESLKDRRSVRTQRAKYADLIFWLIAAWLLCVVLLVFMAGLTCFPFELSDTVLVALKGGSSANVIALFAIVLRWLFPRK